MRTLGNYVQDAFQAKAGLRRAQLVSLVAIVLAAASCWHSGRHVWHKLAGEQKTDAALTPLERQHEFLTQLTLPPAVFDFYAKYVGRGDRVYYQVMPSGLGAFLTLPQAVAAAGRYYLMPAVQVSTLADANVVVTFFDDPTRLRTHFVTQVQVGKQPIFVSRIR